MSKSKEIIEAIKLIHDILHDLARNSTNYSQFIENRMIELRQIIDELKDSKED